MLVVRPQPGQAGHLGAVKAAQLERLQNLLADDHFLGAIAVGERK